MQLIKIEATLAKEFHIQPSEIERMPYWQYELWMKEIQGMVKEQNDRQEKEMAKYNVDKYSRQMSHPPKMPQYKAPNFGSMNIKLPR